MDYGLKHLAARYLRRQAKQLGSQLAGIRRGEDPECIHRARVASRRLRAALRMFNGAYGSNRVKRWRKELRRFARALGMARDRDVQISDLSEFLAELRQADCAPGVARLLGQAQEHRAALQGQVVKATRRLEEEGVVEEMRARAKRALRMKNGDEPSPSSPKAQRQMGKHGLRSLDDILGERESLQRPDDVEGHHALRIAAKRLRYTLEISDPVFENRLADAITSMKRLQSLLGDIHDCDVWLKNLDEFLRHQRETIFHVYESEAPYQRLKVGVEYLAASHRARRDELFRELVQVWGELDERRFWERLRALLELAPAPMTASPHERAEPGTVNGVDRNGGHAPEIRPPQPLAAEPATNPGNGRKQPNPQRRPVPVQG
ncbi:MAG: CHAD domain-containing protein [Planctomycetota bacterium]